MISQRPALAALCAAVAVYYIKEAKQDLIHEMERPRNRQIRRQDLERTALALAQKGQFDLELVC